MWNVTQEAFDLVLKAVRCNICNELEVTGLAESGGFATKVDAARPTAATGLALIAHANPFGVLQLGDWGLERFDEYKTALMIVGKKLWGLGIQEIFLLGCSTATAKGAAGMKWLQEVLRKGANQPLTVWGARTKLAAGHFVDTGLRPDFRDLVCADDANKYLTAADIARAEKWFERPTDDVSDQATLSPQQVTLQEILDARWLADAWDIRRCGIETKALASFFKAPYVFDPGLLTLPLVDIAVRHEDGEFFRMSFLFDGSWARIYPVGYPMGIVLTVIPERRFELMSMLATWEAIDVVVTP